MRTSSYNSLKKSPSLNADTPLLCLMQTLSIPDLLCLQGQTCGRHQGLTLVTGFSTLMFPLVECLMTNTLLLCNPEFQGSFRSNSRTVCSHMSFMTVEGDRVSAALWKIHLAPWVWSKTCLKPFSFQLKWHFHGTSNVLLTICSCKCASICAAIRMLLLI